ncbi:replication initiation protein [Hymenobacter terrenus]|uniref:replication initiation protein n=1 Tax=Hymenobacter terrenus TaxID=1629124 RepID=UPI00069756CB|nr:replication initiation protein [Hymenobacter terrenus]
MLIYYYPCSFSFTYAHLPLHFTINFWTKLLTKANGVITIRLNPALAPYFLQLAGEYTLYKLDGYMALRSWYSMRFFEILAHYKDTCWWEVSMDDYRLFMNCAPEVGKLGKPIKDKAGKPKMKLAQTAHLVENTIEVVQRELATTSYAFTYSLKTANFPGKGRPRVIGFRFDLVQGQLKKVPVLWETHPATGPVIARLRAYKVSELNMALYLEAITLAGVLKMLSDWDHRKVGPRAIDHPEKYCNATIVQAGKAALAAKALEQRQLRLEAKNIAQTLFPGAGNPTF